MVTICITTLVLLGGAHQWVPCPLFAIKPTILVAFEDGPIILEIKATYNGTVPLRIEGSFNRNAMVFARHPFRIQSSIFGHGHRTGEKFIVELQNGDTITDVVRIERLHSEVLFGGTLKSDSVDVDNSIGRFPSGKYECQLRWRVYRPRERATNAEAPTNVTFAQRLVQELKDREQREWNLAGPTLEIDVIASTQSRVVENVRELTRLLSKQQLTHTDIENVFQHVVYNSRPEYLTITIELLKTGLLRSSGDSGISVNGRFVPDDIEHDLICTCLQSNASERQKADAIVDYLAYERVKWADRLFDFLCNPENPYRTSKALGNLLEKKHAVRLAKAPSLWVRTLLYYWAPQYCEEIWIRSLKEQLRAIRPPIPREKIARLLADLDSDSFRARDEATKQLATFGEPVIPTLQAVLKENPSEEVRQRIATVLSRVKQIEPTQLEREMMLSLRPSVDWSKPYPRHREEILEALAESNPDGWFSEEARLYLKQVAEIKKRHKSK